MLQNWKPEVIEPDCFPKSIKCCTFIYSQLFYCQHSVFEVWIKSFLNQKKNIKNKGNFEVMNTSNSLVTCGKCT